MHSFYEEMSQKSNVVSKCEVCVRVRTYVLSLLIGAHNM